MKKLIQRHDAQKYLENGWKVTFVGIFEECEPVEIKLDNFKDYAESCGDWYASVPFKAGDIFYDGGLYKIIRVGKKNIKAHHIGGGSVEFKIKNMETFKDVNVKIPVDLEDNRRLWGDS